MKTSWATCWASSLAPASCVTRRACRARAPPRRRRAAVEAAPPGRAPRPPAPQVSAMPATTSTSPPPLHRLGDRRERVHVGRAGGCAGQPRAVRVAQVGVEQHVTSSVAERDGVGRGHHQPGARPSTRPDGNASSRCRKTAIASGSAIADDEIGQGGVRDHQAAEQDGAAERGEQRARAVGGPAVPGEDADAGERPADHDDEHRHRAAARRQPRRAGASASSATPSASAASTTAASSAVRVRSVPIGREPTPLPGVGQPHRRRPPRLTDRTPARWHR